MHWFFSSLVPNLMLILRTKFFFSNIVFQSPEVSSSSFYFPFSHYVHAFLYWNILIIAG